jgi:hypothetical protein
MQLRQWQQIKVVDFVPSLVLAIIFCALGFIAFAVSFVATI